VHCHPSQKNAKDGAPELSLVGARRRFALYVPRPRIGTWDTWICGGLFDGEFGFVAVAGYDGILEGLVFFVLHAEGMAFVVDEQDFDLAIGAVIFGVGGAVGEDVLVADGVADGGEDVGERSLEHRVEAETTRHGGEGAHLVLSLEVVHAADGAHAAACVGQLADERAGANGEDGDVGSGFDLGEDLVEGELGEGVAASADENDVLSAFDAAGAVEGLVEGVEDVGFREAGDGEGLKRLGDEVLVVGEVVEDVGLEVVGDDGDVVVGAQRLEEAVGGVLHVVDEVVAVGSELQQHDGGDGRLGGADAGEGLGDAVFENEEVARFEAGDELVGLVEDDVDVEVDHGDVDAERVVGAAGVFDGGLGRGGGDWSRVFVLLLFLDDDGAVVGLWAAFVGGGGGLGLLWGRGLGGWSVLRAGGQREENGAGQKKEFAGHVVESTGAVRHHVQLYSVVLDAG
jgi:hypothetical protein